MLSSIPQSLSIVRRPTHWKNSRSTFFKFVTRSTGRIVLTNRTLRWSRPALLNDPHDSQFHLLPAFDYQEAKRKGLEKLWETHYGDTPIDPNNALGRLIRAARGAFPRLSKTEFTREFGEAFDETFASMEGTVARFNAEVQEQMATNKILCLTETAVDTKMWAHYAEAHQGLALRFRSIPEIDSAWGIAEPVIYQNDLPALCDVDYFSNIMSGRASLSKEAILQALVFTKSKAWEHEREWRIFGGSGMEPEKTHEDVAFHRAELDAVVLGCKMPVEEAADFEALVAREFPSAGIYRSIANRNSFTLSFDRLN